MSGDYSRITFDSWQDDFGVLLQQGRPLSDAEWNALTLQLRRRVHAGTLDIIGPAVVPLQTPDGFEMTLIPGGLGVGRGRIYVDGLLAENHGGGAKTWEPRLEDQIGAQVLSYAPLAGFDAQPYYPNPPPLPAGGPHLIYLDVWQREVTHLIRPELIEKAVGVDSTTRLQTVWQVKLLNSVGTGVDCSTPLDKVPGWLPANAPSAGRLSTTTAIVPGDPDPCLIPPAGGYKGLENQLYRIEIHKGGGLGTATFKWSRDNASVETRITHIPSLTQLTVESTGKDSVLRFSDGDWVEITDDWLELHNLHGELRRIKIGGGVDDATRTIILEDPLTPALFPTNAQNETQPARHTRIKRWDQRKQVLDQNGNVLHDLDLAISNGEITVPAGAGVSVLLEHGIIATFTLDPTGGEFKSGDYWVFAARSTDATIEELALAPPLGIHHHYAKLGFVTFPSTISDCRIFWPPPMAEGGDCACTVCVTPEQHASGQLTIQMAIDQVIKAGGGTVCLEVGEYQLQKPVRIEKARSVKLIGKGIASQLRAIDATGAVVINECQDIVLDAFSVQCRGTITAPHEAISVVKSHRVRIEHLAIQVLATSPLWAAIGLAEALLDISLHANILQEPTPIGIRSGNPATGGGVGLADVRITDNDFDCEISAIAFEQTTVHQFVNRICGNRINGCQEAGMRLTGMSAPGYGIEVQANVLNVLGHGIVASVNGLRVLDNDILQAEKADPKHQHGIFLLPGPAASNPISECQVLGNRIQGFKGAGMFVTASLLSAMIKQNQFGRLSTGLVFHSNDTLNQLSIENNQFNFITGPAIQARGGIASYAATGNQISTRSPDPAVLLEFKLGEGVFSHNECYHDGAGALPDVGLRSTTLVVTNNRVVGGHVSFDIRATPDHYTVLGNICRGRIFVQQPSIALPPPWVPLNLQGVV